MTLHDLVKLKRALQQNLQLDPAVNALLQLRSNLLDIKMQIPVIDKDHVDYIDSLVEYYDSVIDKINQPVPAFEQHIKGIEQNINNLTYKLFANNYELEDRYGTPDQVREKRRINVDESIIADAKQRILLHSSWKYPALEIGCRDGDWTQFLIASDPLYIMDRHAEFLESTASRFNEVYQNRLRKYNLSRDHNFSALPQGQFGFIFSWGYFNFVSLDTMTHCLKEISGLLRPGGIFMFTYNDGDTVAGAGKAQNFAQSYMPKELLIPICRSVGFEIANEYDYDPYISWLEIRKSGSLSTIKAHPVLGEIMPRNFE